MQDEREEWWVRDNAAFALVEIGDDRAELPLLRYFKDKLGLMCASLNEPSDSEQLKVLTGIRKLISRLIDKSPRRPGD